MVAEIVPDVVPVSVPIDVGEVKLPLLLLNCAVNTFPVVNVPMVVNGTETDAPAQNEVAPSALVVMLLAAGISEENNILPVVPTK
jgi:hypothetical protein